MYNKEIITFTDIDIKELYIGCLPSEGRYFYKKCILQSPGVFKINLYIPKGDLYYNFFTLENPSQVFLDPNNIQEGAKSWHSIAKFSDKSMLPFIFEFNSKNISKITDETFEFKAIINYKWAQKIELIFSDKNQYNCYDMELLYEHKGKKYIKALVDKNIKIGNSFYFKIYNISEIYYFGSEYKLMKTIPRKFIIDEKAYNAINFPNRNFQDQGVLYHIFPDSFNINKSKKNFELFDYNNLKRKANSKLKYGGTLNGIIEKLDYLTELGINTLYLTPIFPSNSPHRYDSTNFIEIDSTLGTKDEFRELVEKCHSKNIKIILDIILNHCGTAFWAFQDVIKNQENSLFIDWFIINNFPIDTKDKFLSYSCWWNNKSMPQFNLENEEVIKYLVDSCSYWISEFKIDGWRIDVAGELSKGFLVMFCNKMREIKRDIIIIGENWKDSSNYLKGDIFNGVTNYLLWWKAFEPYFIKKTIDIYDFVNEIMQSYCAYPHLISLQCWNLISSHDIPRFRNYIKDDMDFLLAISIQFILPGVPVIYYGDELGMIGGDDPDNRNFTEWDKFSNNNKFYSLFKKLIQIRSEERLIQTGHLKCFFHGITKDILVIVRYDENNEIIILINFNNKSTIFEFEYNKIYKDVITKKNIHSKNICLSGKSLLILKEEKI